MPVQNVEIARLGPDNWRELKTIRLAALLHERAAFSSTYAESVAWPDEDWRKRLANPASLTLIARNEDGPIGMAGALFSADGENHVATVFGMYVAAAYRRQRVGRRLLHALIEEIAARPEFTTIRLWVTPTQHAARQLYASLGFRVVENPDRSMLDGTGAHEEMAMERPVSEEKA